MARFLALLLSGLMLPRHIWASSLATGARGWISRWRLPVGCALALTVGGLLLWPSGCTPHSSDGGISLASRTMRVNLLQSLEQATVLASQPPVYYTSSDTTQRLLALPRNTPMVITLTPAGWRVGTTSLGQGELTLQPAAEGTVAINNTAYRGQYRLVPVGGNRFDVVNDLDLDDYLMSVVSKELLPSWHPEAYAAQCVSARTYALYEKYLPREPRHWDVYADTRSQVYGGVAAESQKSRDAVAATRGIVLAHGPQGDERIFKAYFSACCGGITQSNTDGFNEPFNEVFTEQNVGSLCSASTRYNWGPVVVSKLELTRRFRGWGAKRGHPLRNIGTVRSVAIEAKSRLGRSVRFTVIDDRNLRYSLRSEELRWAVNNDATDGVTLPGSYIENIITDADRIRFVGGHGHGHGVGMCQYCTQARALAGMRHEDILLAAYPGAKLLRAY